MFFWKLEEAGWLGLHKEMLSIYNELNVAAHTCNLRESEAEGSPCAPC